MSRFRQVKLFSLIYIAGMPAELCGGGDNLTADDVMARVHGVDDATKAHILKIMEGSDMRAGWIWRARTFAIVCTR